jgi:hypothetical protein
MWKVSFVNRGGLNPLWSALVRADQVIPREDIGQAGYLRRLHLSKGEGVVVMLTD